jgi:hypothetical protein
MAHLRTNLGDTLSQPKMAQADVGNVLTRQIASVDGVTILVPTQGFDINAPSKCVEYHFGKRRGEP